jgi:DNA-binding transcriptional ArsR family regulator
MDIKHRWGLLDRLTADTVFALPQAIYAELAELLRETIQNRDPGGIRALAVQLADILKIATRSASSEARAVAQARDLVDTSPVSEAFTLGRLGFAYQLAASLADKRTHAAFEETLASATYAPYARALLAEELTGIALAERLGQRVETVSRNLKILRSIGAVDYRRDQTSFVNFLTPAARYLFDHGEETIVRTRLAGPVRAFLRDESGDVPKILRDVQTFSREGDVLAPDREMTIAAD